MNRVVPAIPLPYIQKRARPQRPAVVEGPAPAGTPLPSVSGSGDAQATPKGTPLQPSNSEPQERTALEGVGNLEPSPQQLPDGDPSSKHAAPGETAQSAGGSTEARSPALDAESLRNAATVSGTPSVSETTTDSHVSEPPRTMDPKKGFEPDGEQLLEQVKRNFQDTRFSDCILELYFPDQRAPASLMLDSSLGGRRKGSSGPGVRVRADDKYLRSDAFMVAVQRLYGFSLFEIPLPPPGTDELPMAGGVVEQFKFVISYAAAGHLLQYRSVVVRGMEMAARLIGWDTIELALAFSLGSTAARGTIDFHEKWHYGGATNILYEAIVAFVASQLTSNFEFDFAAEDPEGYHRLPKVDTSKPRPQAKSPSPAIARGSVVQLTPKHRSRLSKIKFGDITLEESKKVPGGDNRGIPQHTPNQLRTLSKILLNLPFDSVKSILESSRFGLDMDDISVREERRLRLITDVLSERESRRLAVLDAVKDGRIANSDAVRRMLSSVEPRTTDECSVLGFREIVAPLATGND
ncbi:unnamed protein product [Parascedosporium putredinis]|uniref:Uncharacterized protein n=1 Tax=Parascedosporium putredinis TaxID=1442378 RepID=A0A9P1M814_9PEZI|nr:unnamed protein product [Parascedosporium putredinis]CAI7989003.1 unnamed protein product [Parascedosporium putredinis]